VSVVNADALAFLSGLDASSVDAVITDPPYCFDKMGAGWSGSDVARRTSGQTVGNLSAGMAFAPDQARLLREWFTPFAKEFRRVLKPGGFAVVFSAPRLSHGFAGALDDAALPIREVQEWRHEGGQFKAMNMRRFGVNSDARVPMVQPQHESIVVAQKIGKGDKLYELHRLHGTALIPPRMPNGDLPGSVLAHRKPSSEERARGGRHPTQKPVSLMIDLAHLWCPEGGLIVDPFAGSGSTGVAAIKAGRRFAGAERSVEFVSIANARIAA
jgi:site-specific DNA-methyltransferase (adenine-specific)